MALALKSTTLAKDGQYFVTTSPTPGTGLATIAAQASFADTAPFILINNNDPTKYLYLDYIRLTCTAAGTAGTNISWAVKTDGVNATRYTSGGSTLTPKNPNTGSGQASSAIVYAGAIVAAAVSSSARLLGHGLFRTVIPVVGDSYTIKFDGDFGGGTGGQVLSGTAPAQVIAGHAPVLIAPTHWVAFHIWLASQSAASSYEVEIGHLEL